MSPNLSSTCANVLSLVVWLSFVTTFCLFIYEIIHLSLPRLYLIVDGLLTLSSLRILLDVNLRLCGHSTFHFFSLPWLIVFSVLILAYALYRWHSQFRSRTFLKENPIWEGVDNLPSGVAFFAEHGFPRLINRRFRQLSFDLTGLEIQNFAEGNRALAHPLPPAKRLSAEPSTFLLPDGSVW